jgi:hypothetical protein
VLLRELLFSLSLTLLTPFPLSLFYLLYWLPSPLQFSSFMILPLFYAELFHVKLSSSSHPSMTSLWIQGAGSTKHRLLGRSEWVFKWLVRPSYLFLTFGMVAFMITWIIITGVRERHEVTVAELREKQARAQARKDAHRMDAHRMDAHRMDAHRMDALLHKYPPSHELYKDDDDEDDDNDNSNNYPLPYPNHNHNHNHHHHYDPYHHNDPYHSSPYDTYDLPTSETTSTSFRYITAISFMALTVILAVYACLLRRRYYKCLSEQQLGDTPRRRNERERRRRSSNKIHVESGGSSSTPKHADVAPSVAPSSPQPPPTFFKSLASSLQNLLGLGRKKSSPQLAAKSPKPSKGPMSTYAKHYPWLTPFGNWSLVLIFFSRSLYHFGEIKHYWSSPGMILVATSDLSLSVTFLFILWDYVPTFCVLFTLNLHHEEEAGGRERLRRRKERQLKLESRRKRQPSYGSVHGDSDGRASMTSIDMGWADDGYSKFNPDHIVNSFSPNDSSGSFMDNAFGGSGENKRNIPDYGVFSMIANSGELVKTPTAGGPIKNTNAVVGSVTNPHPMSGSYRHGYMQNANPRSASSNDGSFGRVGSFAHDHGLPYTGQYGNTVWGAGSIGSSVEDRSGGMNGGRGGWGRGRLGPSGASTDNLNAGPGSHTQTTSVAPPPRRVSSQGGGGGGRGGGEGRGGWYGSLPKS